MLISFALIVGGNVKADRHLPVRVPGFPRRGTRRPLQHRPVYVGRLNVMETARSALRTSRGLSQNFSDGRRFRGWALLRAVLTRWATHPDAWSVM